MGLIMYQEGHVVKSMVCGVCWNYFNSYIYYAKITPKYDDKDWVQCSYVLGQLKRGCVVEV